MLYVHDCALHDGQLLLHYNRETQTLLVGGPNTDRSRVIQRIFDGIEKKIGIFRPVPRPGDELNSVAPAAAAIS